MAGWKVEKTANGVQCSLVDTLEVYIEPIPRTKIELLMDKYTSQEWLAYLIGQVDTDTKRIFVEDLYVPPHKEAGMASAEAEPFHIPPHCVGFIHSHHSMGAFHSGTDDAHVDRNYPVSITVAKQGGTVSYNCVGHRVTPCGKATTVNIEVKFVQPKPPFNTEDFLKKAAKNIAKGEKKYSTPYLNHIHQTQLYGGIPYSQEDISNLPFSWTPKKKGVLIKRIATMDGDMFVDNHGNVLTEKEVEAALKKETGLES